MNKSSRENFHVPFFLEPLFKNLLAPHADSIEKSEAFTSTHISDEKIHNAQMNKRHEMKESKQKSFLSFMVRF